MGRGAARWAVGATSATALPGTGRRGDILGKMRYRDLWDQHFGEKEENAMTIMTPNAKGHERLASLASRYIDVASLPWVPTRFKGVDLKVLMEDKETGLMTALTRFAP